MDIDSTLRTVYTATVENRDGEHVISVPDREIDLETLVSGDQYRVAILAHETESPSVQAAAVDHAEDEREHDGTAEASHDTSSNSRGTDSGHSSSSQTPPVAPGDTRRVEIESIGDQGDGIARIDNGYVVIVPDTDVGERVEIEIDTATETVGFAEVTERISYYA